ncbi:MAG: single-stranded-DNA-specific exonuclease RecJ, partial [Clostridia bacterium]|nr:single-stranded-DNA-specific exonuclease RecJ [Clostridia bacterium]
MSIPKKWLLFDKNDNKAELIAQKFNISPVTAQVLINRGITEESQVYDFINPDIGQFLNPFDMKNMKEATECICFHIEKGSKIAVFGDYDVDGITSTYILYDYLKNLGVDAVYYIPNRSDEGYGLNTGAVDSLCAEGVQLIITVDVGITAINEVDYIKSKGIDVVVTDHHTPIDKLPEANAVINPKIDGCKYANKELAGVGVAFKLVYALSGCKKEIIDKYSAFACIGTIADMVPLVGENRFIASYGLKCIPHCDNIGLKSLIEISNIDADCIDSGNISFAIAPRLNAAGRIDSAETSVNLFLTKDDEEAHRLASILDSENKERQDEEQKILESAIGIIEEQKLYNDNVIVVANHGWHHGIIGIVSSKITEKYYKPSTVISINDDGSAKASGRSISGFNLFDSLSACSDVLTKFGGHELAAGFSLNESDIDLFRNKINEYSKGIMT